MGIPCIYYGTELAMEGSYDPDSRRGFDWNEENWDKALLDKVKEIIALRKLDVIQEGSISIGSVDDCFKMTRSLNKKSITLMINNGQTAYDIVNCNQIITANRLNVQTQELLPGGFVVLG